ncbi:MAG TPA: polysaccharide pyruvyl transferase family protein [Burkholderiaceae bacterium]|nr:polysaccharide pyruvyl transferase family protein [Burkholderiaceae bacterium]
MRIDAQFLDVLDGARLARVKTLEIRLCGSQPAAKVVAQLIERLPALSALTLSYAGPIESKVTAFAVDLHEGCARRGVDGSVQFELDASADAFAALGACSAGAPAATFVSVLEVSRKLRALGLVIRWLVPMVPALVYRLEAVFSLARDEGVEPVLVPVRNSGAMRSSELLSGEDRLFVSDFIAYRLLDEEKHLHDAIRIASYRALKGQLEGTDARMIAGTRKVLVLSADGERTPQWTLHGEERPNFANGARRLALERWADLGASRLLAQIVEVSGVLREGGLALAQWVCAKFATLIRGRREHETERRLKRVLLIGAYGGEHIGDAAILGGVLFRINRRYGTTEGVLMSQRPAHTRHLMPMLDTPFKLDVDSYELANIRHHLASVDAVVFAGGPLIDLPKQLVKHLYAASLARRADKPFIAEGIGPGPFPRWPSEWTARRLVHLADRISLRTAKESDATVMRGLTPEVGRDPAFDYLATRGAVLGRLRETDRQWIDRLVQGTQGRLLIGLNLRPIRHLFTVGAPSGKRAEYTSQIEARFEERLAEGMRLFHRACSAPPCFIFFPMNAIQFGMSDLRSAYRVRRRLGADIDFRVWEADASLDGVVALLRRLDIVISMRFHATIFALAQQRKVVGIDYRVGQRDKVGELLSDFGESQNCSRIDEMTSDWLLQRLSAFAAAESTTS